ncbi:MAG TPA: NHL repeat-containing protein [Candidatus Tumulicola sp.]|jgi:hypothetical protein
MFSNSARRLASSAALILLAGCAGGSLSGNPTLARESATHVPAGYRLIAGPAVIGPSVMRVASQPNHGGYLLRQSAKTLYVADPRNNQVLIYDPSTVDPSPIGSITDKMSFPSGLAVDRKGTLYVANQGNNTVTEYRFGKTKAFLKLSSGLSAPYGIGVDSAGRVFVSNLTGGLVGFKPGKSVPYETVAAGPNPCGVAIDKENNVYVASDSENRVYVIPAGSSTSQNLGLMGVNGPIGLAFKDGDTLYVGNYGGDNVTIYPSGAKSPSATIVTGMGGPTLSGFVKGGVFYQSNEDSGLVQGYKGKQTSPFTTISGIPQPLGVASFPKPKA